MVVALQVGVCQAFADGVEVMQLLLGTEMEGVYDYPMSFRWEESEATGNKTYLQSVVFKDSMDLLKLLVNVSFSIVGFQTDE